MATVRGVLDTTRNVWVTFDNALYDDKGVLVENALDHTGHAAEDFPFGSSITRNAWTKSATVVLHKVDPHS